MSDNNNKSKKKISNWVNNVGGFANNITHNVIDGVKETSSIVAEKASEVTNDVKEFAEEKIESIKDNSDKLAKQLHEAKIEADKKRLRPVFKDELDSNDFKYPAMIRVVQYDKQHMENEACSGAIGFMDYINDAKVLSIYKENFDEFNIKVHPNIEETIYYQSACSDGFYVDLNEYFNYHKMQRINELNQLAYDLGANYFKVTVMESKRTLTKKNLMVNAKIPKVGGVGYESDNNSREMIAVKIESEMNLHGHHHPTKPNLKYFQKENDIISLINMRLSNNNQLKSKTFQLKYNSATLIKEKEAMQIESAYKAFKMKAKKSIMSEVQNENQMTFEYYIEFPMDKLIETD